MFELRNGDYLGIWTVHMEQLNEVVVWLRGRLDNAQVLMNGSGFLRVGGARPAKLNSCG